MSSLTVHADETRRWQLLEGDALEILPRLPDGCFDSVVCDPPYAIGLGPAWDGVGIRQAVSRPGNSLSAPDAFQRWTTTWAQECLRVLRPGGFLAAFGAPRTFHRLVSGVEDAGFEARDQLLWLFAQGIPKSRRLPGGLGTTLKPAYEPILLARKPFAGGTLENIEQFGTGALNIDATRIARENAPQGYWPAHLAVSHHENCSDEACAAKCAVAQLDHSSEGSPLSRLFFCPKASSAERDAGCGQIPKRPVQLYKGSRSSPRMAANLHPTVKPIALMAWLTRLVTPPDGLVLDPFTGSGSTGAAAVLEGRRFLGIERETEHVDVACARITHWAHRSDTGTA